MADNDGKLYIIITDRLPEGTSPGGISIQNNSESNSKKLSKNNNILLNYAEHKFFDFVRQEVRTAIDYQISNIGNFTGDYITQRHVSAAKQGVLTNVGLITTAIAAGKFAGPIGAIIATTVSIGANLINMGLDYKTNMIQNSKTNYSISQLKDRSGLNTLRDGSRGTEN